MIREAWGYAHTRCLGTKLCTIQYHWLPHWHFLSEDFQWQQKAHYRIKCLELGVTYPVTLTMTVAVKCGWHTTGMGLPCLLTKSVYKQRSQLSLLRHINSYCVPILVRECCGSVLALVQFLLSFFSLINIQITKQIQRKIKHQPRITLNHNRGMRVCQLQYPDKTAVRHQVLT